MADVSQLIDSVRLKAIANRLREQYDAQQVILYGSAARNEVTEHSDIDLLVIAVTKERFYERMASVLAVVRDLSRGMPLSPLVLTPEELADRLGRGDQFVREIVHSGVAL
ncbi:hypothetical protein CLG94_10890 [Candidatus Methylomirabilis limnetica]|jgi:predicted nucleotidyltransferase|uniref:Polymerase beta nucleotidyltransferase domain-containing protein n=1 Tax=Candidatus Methylomirabilis limnetica TaxID=2033718 RepID=A0A2T4TVR7_9BACT|nr:nucleotidyltransferase domain-containing protein [Candidatus Methylomirabilis limnetica]PTL35203.1 hypothetical protein CLG94_10890 [Candidatus Methylomirabilis limnetica]